MLGEKENYKYLVILEADTIKELEKIRKEYVKRMREILKGKLCSRNLIKQGINTSAVPF